MTRLIIAGAALALATAACAHQAPSGAAYPVDCCNNRDCFPVHYSAITREGDGWAVRTKDGVIRYRREHLRPAIDDGWHACWGPGTTVPYCLIPAGGGS